MLGSSFHLGTTELSRCVIVATLHWISNAPLPMSELFSSRVSVDQDLSVIVAETINDDDVKQRLVPIVFHACVTRQRSAGSTTRLSCSHVHGRTNNTPLQTRVREKRGATQTDAENMKNSGDNTGRATMRSTTHTPQLCLHADPKREDKTVEFSTKEPRIPENMVGTKNTNNCKTRISSTPAEHDRGLFIQFVTKASRSLAK